MNENAALARAAAKYGMAATGFSNARNAEAADVTKDWEIILGAAIFAAVVIGIVLLLLGGVR